MPVYRSTDASAPSLAGTAGSLVALLKACLVDGYGSKAGAGWTMPFTGTPTANQAVFKQGGAGAQSFLQVDDNAPNVSVVGRQARVWGFEAMSAYGIGSNPYGVSVGSFPLYTDTSFYHCFRKSTTADATVRQWVIAADAKTFYLFIKTGDSTIYWIPQMFGDFYSYITADPWKVTLMGYPDASWTSPRVPLTDPYTYGNTNAGYGWIPRGYAGMSTPKRTNLLGNGSMAHQYVNYGGAPYQQYPAQMSVPNADGGVYVSRYRIIEEIDRQYAQGGHTLRGHLRGLYAWWGHPSYYSDQDTFGGRGSMAGKTFQLFQILQSSSGGIVCHALETSDTWEASA